MCKKGNEVILKQQRPVQSQYEILEAFMINFVLMIFCWLEAMLTERLRRKSSSKKKLQIKAWYRILGTEISSYEDFHCKTTQISEENELHQAKWKYFRQLSLCNNAWLRFYFGNNI